MYEIESVFIGESQQSETLLKDEDPAEMISNFKVGDVICTRLAPNSKFTLNCLQCLKSFQDFPEFTLHIEEHFVQGDVFDSSNDSSIKNKIKSKETMHETNFIKYNDENEPDNDAMEYVDGLIEEEESEWNCESKTSVCEQNCDTNDENVTYQTHEETDSIFDTSQQIIEGVTYKKVGNIYKCMMCKFKSAKKSNLKSHITVHIKSKNIFCPICMKGFRSVHYVQKHIKSIHKQTISAEDIRKAQNTLKQIVKPKKSDGNLYEFGNSPGEILKLKLQLLSSNYWRTEGKKYHCPLCIQWFTASKYVQKHIRLVHGRHFPLDDILAAQIQTELKPESTKSIEMVTQKQIESLQRQQTKNMDGKRIKSFECFECHRNFLSEKAVRSHMPLHEGIQYACPLCEKFFSMQKYVRDHLIYKHGFDKKSKLPPLKTRTIENFEYHKPIVSRFECYLCHRTYPSRSKLNSHMKSHIDILECSICSKIFKSTESRRRHMQLHLADPNTQHYCLICNKAFLIRRYMLSHMRTSHRNPMSKSEKPPKTLEQLTCKICYKVYDKQGIFNKHVKKHSQEPTHYMCDHCGEEFKNRNTLSRHLSSVRNKIGKNYFKCSLCQKDIPKKREEEHIKFHNREFCVCEVCGAQCITEGMLNTHKKRKHSGLKYQCDICIIQFDQPKKLLHHRRSHIEPMEINCSICNLGFFSARSLAKHEVNKHGQNSNTFESGNSDSETDTKVY